MSSNIWRTGNQNTIRPSVFLRFSYLKSGQDLAGQMTLKMRATWSEHILAAVYVFADIYKKYICAYIYTSEKGQWY